MKKGLVIILSIFAVAAAVIITLSMFHTYTVIGINEKYIGEYTLTLLPNNKFTAKIADYASSGSYALVTNIDKSITYYFYDDEGNLNFTAHKSHNGFRVGNFNFIKTSLF